MSDEKRPPAYTRYDVQHGRGQGMTVVGPSYIGSSQPKPFTGICVRCKRDLPADRKHAAACEECVSKMRPASEADVARADKRASYVAHLGFSAKRDRKKWLAK